MFLIGYLVAMIFFLLLPVLVMSLLRLCVFSKVDKRFLSIACGLIYAILITWITRAKLNIDTEIEGVSNILLYIPQIIGFFLWVLIIGFLTYVFISLIDWWKSKRKQNKEA